MVNETVASLPIEVLGGIISIGRWLEAIGVILIGWIIITIVNFWINRKRLHVIQEVREDIRDINKRISSLEDLLKNKK